MFGLQAIQDYFWPREKIRVTVSESPVKEERLSIWTKPIIISDILPLRKIAILLFIGLMIAYFYRDQMFVVARPDVNKYFEKGWYIKSDYKQRELLFFVLERNLIMKWYYGN